MVLRSFLTHAILWFYDGLENSWISSLWLEPIPEADLRMYFEVQKLEAAANAAAPDTVWWSLLHNCLGWEYVFSFLWRTPTTEPFLDTAPLNLAQPCFFSLRFDINTSRTTAKLEATVFCFLFHFLVLLFWQIWILMPSFVYERPVWTLQSPFHSGCKFFVPKWVCRSESASCFSPCGKGQPKTLPVALCGISQNCAFLFITA